MSHAIAGWIADAQHESLGLRPSLRTSACFNAIGEVSPRNEDSLAGYCLAGWYESAYLRRSPTSIVN